MDELTIALISEVFYGDNANHQLVTGLQTAKEAGATLAVLPELACNPWSPSTTTLQHDDAEELNGPRCQMQAQASKEVGIGLIGSAIVTNGDTRFNTCLLWDDCGELVGTYQKHHLPEEDGFWETSHYNQGVEGFPIFELNGWNIGIQICSDMNRPQGSQLLSAAGAQIIIGPRATERATYDRWKPVWIATALTTGCYVCSVNRPAPENGVLLGGDSIAVSPSGEVIAESCDAITTFTARQSTIKQARIDYPGYLPCRADMYAQGWNAIKDTNDE